MNWEKILPSIKARKIILWFFGSLILIFLIFNNFQKRKEIKQEFQYKKNAENLEKIKKQTKIDTDGDGLLDWQELLYGTNIEIRDSDLDGVSDYDEVRLGRDPTIFGIGKKEEIEKIEATKQNIISLEEQKRNYQKYVEEVRNKHKKEEEKTFKMLEEMNNNSKNQKLNEAWLEKKKEINKIAEAVLTYESDPEVRNILRLEKLFSYLGGNPDNQKITQSDLDYYNKISGLNLATANALKKVKIKDSILKKNQKLLEDGYRMVGENLAKLLNFNLSSEERKNIIIEYGEGQKKILEGSKKINLFIKTYKIKFIGEEPGSIFDYAI